MNFPNDKYQLVLAEEKDLAEIKSIFEDGQFDGGIAVQYLRNPNPITSFEREGDKVFFLVLKDNIHQKLMGLGACIVRRVYKGGEVLRMGYLAGLKLLPEYQKKLLFIPHIYQQLYEATKDHVDFYFTTILKDNVAAQTMLEKPRKVMPLYQYLGDYRVYFCKAGIKKTIERDDQYSVRRCSKEEIKTFYLEEAHKADLSLEAIDAYDLKNATYYGLFKDNSIVGCGYVLNQQDYKQYVVKKYNGVYKLLSKLPTRLLGYPSLPAINETANCGSAGIWVKDHDAFLAHKLWQFIRQNSKELDFLMIGFYEKHPLRAYFEKTKHIQYDSRCYIVDWQRNRKVYEELQGKNLYIDVAFL
ncbi:hypothetical protein [Alkaliphilus serpentinus]|uniref:Uncharacterized protein n=1 Tax=Alkaliphilus serpentinus TaxID=1482731 RepID=A0A833ME79_9FIRM|nr:hypothetical protein [Alkaliphilus serpentinus]KAB3530515.1 hypothetical protein F8153_06600 [Alkaliphilus serpentinus]